MSNRATGRRTPLQEGQRIAEAVRAARAVRPMPRHATGVAASEIAEVDAVSYEATFGEPLSRTLDLDTWLPAEQLGALYARLEEEVRLATKQAGRTRSYIRDIIFRRLETDELALPDGGVYQATVEQMERIHRGLLFNGQVDACDGSSVVHDSLPLTIAQIGVCLVCYHGNAGSWVHRLFRRDLRIAPPDPEAEMTELLERRMRRGPRIDSATNDAEEAPDRRDQLSRLGRRGIMAYAERAVLADRSTARWRMGHGSAIPYELLTGSGSSDLLTAGIDVLERLRYLAERETRRV